MVAFNRNIFTSTDISNFVNPLVGTPATMDAAPPAGTLPIAAGGAPAVGGAPALGGESVVSTGAIAAQSGDGYLTKLLKFVPLEVLGAYLFVESLITTNVKEASQLQAWLFWTLLITVVVAMVYMRTVLAIVRATQILMAAVGIAVYVFATGGWFATTSWYQGWYSSIALAAFATLVGVIKLPELRLTTPTTPTTPTPGPTTPTTPTTPTLGPTTPTTSTPTTPTTPTSPTTPTN